MSVIGTVDSLWRYPVKSINGEELRDAFVGFSGIYGDRIFAIWSSASIRGFPYLNPRGFSLGVAVSSLASARVWPWMKA